MAEFLLYGFPASLVLIGIIEAIKRSLGLNTRYVPLLSLGLGIILAWLANSFIVNVDVISGGLVTGLIASGLWSGTKKTLLNK